ncbi:hypothetical protein BG60_24295 [Caballeronia zhejiangensis]|uniref:Uncharacterized protein n=1 Tax=Caballeronia zhejiangensis TaxID=871203 RepID=A0A656QEV1_9BURK|nr:hypothetical protein BG60_24295 [Caballeronia zhejiangensis]
MAPYVLRENLSVNDRSRLLFTIAFRHACTGFLKRTHENSSSAFSPRCHAPLILWVSLAQIQMLQRVIDEVAFVYVVTVIHLKVLNYFGQLGQIFLQTDAAGKKCSPLEHRESPFELKELSFFRK